jgi:hypothetical protein
MIPEHMEPKGLAPDAEPISAHVTAIRQYNDALLGSRKLRDAIMFAKGQLPPDDKPPPVIRIIPEKIQPRAPHSPIANIQATVAEYYQISPLHLKSARKDRSVAHPRQIAMYLASELTRFSIAEIGRRFGGRDHTTVLYALKAVKSRMNKPDVFRDVQTLREALEG